MPTPEIDPSSKLRRLSDAKTMRALSHPVRLALLESLTLDGPLTATQASERIGESPTTCSFHLRQLARYGFVEEAGPGPGRTRPWKMTTIGMTVSDGAGDREMGTALSVLQRLLRERYFQRLQTWEETRSSYPKEWQDASDESEFVLWITPDEAKAVEQETFSTLMRFQDRLSHPELRPDGSLPVEVLTFFYPFRPPEAVAGPAALRK
jgi:DNA-binding transcriptional ArsR family regulator